MHYTGTFIAKMEERSGVKFHEAQVALARQWIGTPIAGAETQTKVAIKSADQSDAAPTVSGDTKVKTQEIDLPPSAEVARHIIGTFERGAEGLRGDEDVADSVSQHALMDTTSLWDEKWLGTEEEELNS